MWIVQKSIFLQFGPLDTTNWVMENLPKACRIKCHKLSAQFLTIEKTEFFYQLNYLFLKLLHYSWRMLVWQPCKDFLWKSQKFRLKCENDNKSMKIPTNKILIDKFFWRQIMQFWKLCLKFFIPGPTMFRN